MRDKNKPVTKRAFLTQDLFIIDMTRMPKGKRIQMTAGAVNRRMKLVAVAGKEGRWDGRGKGWWFGKKVGHLTRTPFTKHFVSIERMV